MRIARITIAEQMGYEWWQFSAKDGTPFILLTSPTTSDWREKQDGKKVERPPDPERFADDAPELTLDWLHEVEKTLDGLGLLDKYRHMLRIIVINDADKSNAAENYDWHASKEQRARAFIETMNNWNTPPMEVG